VGISRRTTTPAAVLLAAILAIPRVGSAARIDRVNTKNDRAEFRAIGAYALSWKGALTP